MVAVAIAIVAVSTETRIDGLAAAFAWAGVAAVVVGVVLAWPTFGVVGALLLGAGFVATRFEEPARLNLAAVLVGPALLLVCELTSWSTDARISIRAGARNVARATTVALVLVLASGLTAVVAAVSTMPVGDALGLAALGAASVVLVTAAIVRSARSVASRP